MIAFAELKDVLKGWKLALLVLSMMLAVILNMITYFDNTFFGKSRRIFTCFNLSAACQVQRSNLMLFKFASCCMVTGTMNGIGATPTTNHKLTRWNLSSLSASPPWGSTPRSSAPSRSSPASSSVGASSSPWSPSASSAWLGRRGNSRRRANSSSSYSLPTPSSWAFRYAL